MRTSTLVRSGVPTAIAVRIVSPKTTIRPKTRLVSRWVPLESNPTQMKMIWQEELV